MDKPSPFGLLIDIKRLSPTDRVHTAIIRMAALTTDEMEEFANYASKHVLDVDPDRADSARAIMLAVVRLLATAIRLG